MKRLIVGVAAVVMLVGMVDGATLNVPSGPYPTIQAGIAAASSGDTVLVGLGTYNEDISFNGKNITLTSTDPCDPCVVAGTIIQGTGTGRVVFFWGTETSASKLAGFTITGGNNSGDGGGIVGNACLTTIQRCVITGNTSSALSIYKLRIERFQSLARVFCRKLPIDSSLLAIA